MQALVLDFDGVLFDSARESFAVARRSYLDLRPDSRLAQRDLNRLFERFVELMPLGNRSEDYAVVLEAIETGRSLPDQETYDAFRSTRDPDWLRHYHDRYYEVRREMSGTDPQVWFGLMPPFDSFIGVLERRAGSVRYALATAKDRRAVDALLSFHRLGHLFPPDLILDKETGASKAVHLARLGELLGIDFPRMTFVDDKVNHLDSVARLGVRCALAAWGYNGPREHALAASRGYLVCTLEDVEARLFG